MARAAAQTTPAEEALSYRMGEAAASAIAAAMEALRSGRTEAALAELRRVQDGARWAAHVEVYGAEPACAA